MFIVLEGIDGAGKTTLADILAKELGFESYATPPASFRLRRDQVDRFGSPEEKFQFFLEGVEVASNEIWDMLAQGRSVICDRYWMTTLVYHQILGVKVADEDFVNLLVPDLTILLLVSADEQMRRLSARGFSVNDRQMLGKYNLISQAYKRLFAGGRFPNTAVNTDNLVPSEVAKLVSDHVSRLE